MKEIDVKKLSRLFIPFICVLCIACLVSFTMLLIRGVDAEKLSKSSSATEILCSSPAALKPTRDYGEHYINSIIFVGDTTVSSIAVSELLAYPHQIWSGVNGHLALDYNLSTTAVVYSADNEGASIASAASIVKPEYMVITVGIENGVSYCSEEKFKEYYCKLIETIKESSPQTKIILQSIFPVSKVYEKHNPELSNERINQANLWIQEIAEGASVKYLDTASVLKQKNGKLDPTYDSGDGIHLNSKGFQAMLDYIRTHGYK